MHTVDNLRSVSAERTAPRRPGPSIDESRLAIMRRVKRWLVEGREGRSQRSGVAGDSFLEERREDVSLVLRPDTSAAAIRGRLGTEPVSDEEFERRFCHLLTDGEG